MASYAEYLDIDDIVTKIIPNIKPISNDNIQHTRCKIIIDFLSNLPIAALAGSLLQLCPLIGKKHTNDHILSIFLLLLRDEYSEVRVNLFKNLDDITKVMILT